MLFPLYDLNPHRRIPWLTLLIIAINLGVMIWLAPKPDQRQYEFRVRHGFVPKRVEQLSNPKLVVQVERPPQIAQAPLQNVARQPDMIDLPPKSGQVYASMFTMMFIHGGWLHLAFNMWFLWIFGNNVEDRLGHLVYLLFYILGGLLALACHWVTDPGSTLPVVGASGAVAAVLGAYAITYPSAKVRTLVFFGIILLLDLPALLVLGFWFLGEFLAGILAIGVPGGNGGVAVWAHVGGFVAGVVLMPILSLGAPPPDEDWRDEVEEMFGPPAE